MADANGTAVWERYAPFIREFIYAHGWQALNEVQLEAARVLFETDDNLLLPSATASGKTEAAFSRSSPSSTRTHPRASAHSISRRSKRSSTTSSAASRS